MNTQVEAEEDILERLSEIHNYVETILPEITLQFDIAVNLDEQNRSKLLLVNGQFSELKERLIQLISHEEYFLFPFIREKALVRSCELGLQPLINKEVIRIQEEQVRFFHLLLKIEAQLVELKNDVKLSPSLKKSLILLSGFFFRLKEFRIKFNELIGRSGLLPVPESHYYLSSIDLIMKNILVPVDYSAESENAVVYASEIARISGASITLLHLYQVPVPSGEVPVMVMSSNDYYNEEKHKLDRYTERLKKEIPGVNLHSIVKADLVAPGIASAAEEVSADLIIMGLSAEGDLYHLVFSHNAVAVSNESKVPVLGIPYNVIFRPTKKILFACDLKNDQPQYSMNILYAFAKLFQPEVNVVNVLKSPDELPTIKKAIAGLRLTEQLEGVNHVFHFPVNEDIDEGIMETVNTYDPDLIIMVHHKRGLLKRLFSVQHTKKVMNESTVPVLVLPD